jgi:hypothetical protein
MDLSSAHKKNETAVNEHVEHAIDHSFIQFHFYLKGGTARFNEGSYNCLYRTKLYLLYNPTRDLPVNLNVVTAG